MQKSAAAFRTISEVGDALDVPAHVLRFWESKFNQIKPVKRGGGRRYYRPEDVGLIRGIQHLLYEEGMTIKGAQKVLNERGVKSVTELGKELLSDGQTAEKPAPSPKIVAKDAPPTAVAPAEPVQVAAQNATSHQDLQAAYKTLRRMRRRIRRQIKSLS